MSQEWDYPPPRWKREPVGTRIRGRAIEHEAAPRRQIGVKAYLRLLKQAMRLTALFFIGLASFAATVFFYFLFKG